MSALILVLVLCAPAAAHREIEIDIAEISERIEADPDNVHLYLRRGELHRLHEDWPAALADYERSRDLAPDVAEVDFCLGRMWLEAGRPAQAHVVLDRFLEARPEDPNALVLRARARAQLGRHLDAAGDFSRAIERSPRPTPELYIQRARALSTAGESHFDEALRGLEEGLVRTGGPVTLELEALELELLMRRTDAALMRLDRLAASSRPEPFLARRAEILERAHRVSEARRSYGDALAAIQSLPPQRRKTRAIAEIERRVRAGLARVSRGEVTP